MELREETGVQTSLTERLVRSRLQWAVVRSLRSIFCPDRDTPDKSTKLGTSLHKLFIIHSGRGCPG